MMFGLPKNLYCKHKITCQNVAFLVLYRGLNMNILSTDIHARGPAILLLHGTLPMVKSIALMLAKFPCFKQSIILLSFNYPQDA